LISYKSSPGGGTTDYAAVKYSEALEEKNTNVSSTKIFSDDVYA
jgi:hypothetical protein